MIVEILITLLIIFLVYASCNIRSNIYLKVFCKKQTEDKIVSPLMMDRTRYKPPKYCKYSKNNKYRLVSSASVTK